ncbi:hypothetical protein HYX17_01965 [Candidatus Woesearchaeota archaeon]|nr:hypothetical protein [Candidatus Woesearchaeota archaeon]
MKFKKYEYTLLIIALILIFILVYSPHSDYKYPLHVDEWQHISKAVYFSETKELQRNPNLVDKPFQPNLEPGFTVFLSFLFRFIDPIMGYKFLPAIFATLAAFILFLLVHQITSNFYIGLFSILFFSSLKSNINIQGLWFFLPLTLAIPIIFLYFLFFLKYFEENKIKYFFYSVIPLILLLFVHAISLILLLIVSFIYLLLHHKEIENFRPLSIFLMIIPTSIIILLFILIRENSEIFNLLLDWLIIEEGWGYVEKQYFLPSFYGIIPTLLAFIGIYPSIKNKNSRIFLIISFITLSLIFLFHNFGFSILFPYQRVLYYAMIGLVPLSSIGLYSLLGVLKGKLVWLIPIILLIVFYFTFFNYYNLDKDSGLYHVVEDKDYEAIKLLSQFKSKVIMSPLPQSSAIYPISKNLVIAHTKGNLLSGNIDMVRRFYEVDCDEKTNIIKRYDIDFILSQTKLDCGYTKVYNDKTYIYKLP